MTRRSVPLFTLIYEVARSLIACIVFVCFSDLHVMSPSSADAPIVIFGTANFGSPESNGTYFGPVTVEEGMEYLNVLRKFNVKVLDTARIYVCSILVVSLYKRKAECEN
jgi:hypothetical protein